MVQMHKLLKSQKNEVFKILQKVGLEPANFSWTTQQVQDIRVPRLNYLDGKYYFRFGERNQGIYSPGTERIVQEVSVHLWAELTKWVKDWASSLKREIEVPDLWQEMEKYKTSVSLALPEQLLNEPIPTYEAEQIADKLHELANEIEKQFQLTEDQNQFVRSKLTYLVDAAKRQRSVDWVHTSIGVSITIMLGLALAPDRAKELWQLIESLLRGFIHLIGS